VEDQEMNFRRPLMDTSTTELLSEIPREKFEETDI
jgi:hypothetical protein